MQAHQAIRCGFHFGFILRNSNNKVWAGTRINTKDMLGTIIYATAALLPGALASLLLGNPKLDCEGGRGQSDKEGDSDKKSCDLMIVKILISDHRIVM